MVSMVTRSILNIKLDTFTHYYMSDVFNTFSLSRCMSLSLISYFISSSILLSIAFVSFSFLSLSTSFIFSLHNSTSRFSLFFIRCFSLPCSIRFFKNIFFFSASSIFFCSS
uniref:Uncharacterized protein n=1 Tax=Cacopsylla melanoneura TaxID=428564 RepID=A0A8D8WNZ3_9HEMI